MATKTKPMYGAPMADRDYQGEDDHRTMMRAAEIQNDKSRMTGVRKHHRKQTKAIALVQRSMMGGKR